MNAKEAREAIAFQNSDSVHKGLNTMAASIHGQGYLEALEGEEVKALVEAVEDAKKHSFCNSAADPHLERCFYCRMEKALAQYREAVKGVQNG